MTDNRIAGYVFKAYVYCPEHILGALPTEAGEAFEGWASRETLTPEARLSEIADAFGIDRENEKSFYAEDFPKKIQDAYSDYAVCHTCGARL